MRPEHEFATHNLSRPQTTHQSKEDVWRGLIAEVILGSIQLRDANVKTVVSAAKKFGVFLGRSFMHVLSGLKLKGKIPAEGIEGELNLAALKEIPTEYREAVHPEEAYLNEFESSLTDWIRDTVRAKERLVIFIDDLDRCMPDVALQVLEALKLYLNIDKLIFVVGVDRTVIDGLVKEQYKKMGLDEEKCKQYLAKMFQIEIELIPSEIQVEAFLDQQLGQLDSWSKELSQEEREIFRGRILIPCCL